MSRQALVLDANILVRAVLGKRVFKLLNQYHSTTVFFAPDEAFADAEKYLPQIFESRGLDWGVGAAVLSRLPTLVQRIEFDVYCEFETNARQRIRDVRDWPVLEPPRWPWTALYGRRIRISSAAAWLHGPPAPYRCI